MYSLNDFLLYSEDATTSNYIQLTPHEENDSLAVREVILSQTEPIIVSDGEENDLRPSSPPPSNPPSTSHRLRHTPAAIVLNYVWRNWWEVSPQLLLYDRSPSLSCISDDDDELDWEVTWPLHAEESQPT